MEEIGFNKGIKKLIPVISDACIDTQLLFARLKEAIQAKEELVTYEALSEVIGSDIQGYKNYAHLATARRKIQREIGVVTNVVTNTGISFLLTGKEISLSVKKDIDSVRRKSKKGLNKLVCVQDAQSMNNEERIKYNTYCSALGVLHSITSQGSMRHLETTVSSSNMQTLSLTNTLEAFKK